MNPIYAFCNRRAQRHNRLYRAYLLAVPNGDGSQNARPLIRIWIRRLVIINLILGGMILLFLFAGCASRPVPVDEPASKISTPERVRAIETAHNYLGVQVNEFEDWLNGASDPIPRAEVIAHARTIRLAFNAETKAIEPLAPAVAKDTKKAIAIERENASLRSSDPVRTWLTIIGVGLIVLGVAGIVGSIFIQALNAIPAVRSVAVALLAAGLMFATIAHFLTQIYIVGGCCLIAGLIAGGVWLYTHRKIVRTKAAKQLAKRLDPKPLPPAAT